MQWDWQMTDDIVKGVKELDDYDDLTLAYMDMLDKVNELIQQHDPMEIAAIMMTQALSIYKTTLSSEDYDKLVGGIVKFKDEVIEFQEINVRNLH